MFQSAVMRQAVRAGMMPTLNQMAVVGVVSLPGMMTGQVLAGQPPLQAVRYQIVIMFLIAAASALGTVGAVLVSPEIMAEVISDGKHLDPMIVKLIIESKGINGVVLITDAMEGAAMPDAEYMLGGFTVIVKDGTAAFPDGTPAPHVVFELP